MAANFRLANLALLLASLGGVSIAHAGLGAIKVLSADGEAFAAEIPIVDENIDDYALAGLADRNNYPLLSPYSGSAEALRFSVIKRGDGHIQKVLVKGPASFSEPLLKFAVEVNWPGGKLVREFEVDYRRDGPRNKSPQPQGDGESKQHVATPDQTSRLDGSALSDLRVSSRLGEPLLAELSLLGNSFDLAEQLQINIVPDTSAGGGKDLLRQVASIGYQIDRGIDGRRVLQLVSTVPITLANLGFRIEVRSGNVQAQKSYRLMLDGSSDRLASASAPAAQEESKTVQAAAPKAATAEAPKSSGQPSAASTEPVKAYQVRAGDSLSAIAMRVHGHDKGEDVAGKLLKDNPDAFINGNPNRLLAGAKLSYPARWQLKEAAREQVKPAGEAKAGKAEAKPGNMAKLLAEGGKEAGLSAADEAKPAETHAPAKKEAKPAVKMEAKPVAAAVPAKPSASSPAALAAEKQMRDKLAKQDQALKDTEQRTKALEDQIRAMQQSKPAAPQAAPAPAAMASTAQSAPVNALASKIAAEQKPAAPPARPEPKPAASLPATLPMKKEEQAKAPAMAKEQLASAPPVVVPVAKPIAPPMETHPAAMKHEVKPQPASGVVDDALAVLSDKDVLIKLGGGAAAVALVALLLMRRKRGAAVADDEGGATGEAGGEAKKAARLSLGPLTSLMSSLKKSDGIDLGSVDVMAEAEVYLAYGRDDQAILILREGLDKEPMRQDLRYKLLEVLASQPDKEEFLKEVAVTKGMFNKDSTMWMRVCELGRNEVPGHPLFDALEPAAPSRSLAPEPAPILTAPARRPEPVLEAELAAPLSAPAAAPSAPVGGEDEEKMALAKLYMEMGDKETAETLMREARQGR
ncbi:FimV family protein [Chromobacterium sp. IIBBL 290-4]|uniref:type IV pilus assembly protein FimV n=1 Tax=Chromobacterium sp. IIBBL 290-4 TaxID=2953890 RepID=UPI0020B8EFE8|nr:hypothetical protein [Chromobacterium sp. IIBBL 290-4]UTH73815.1 hypothetical protein NKT35_20070 [Chromobacterium sp. IIBBL 290-4]